MQCSLFLPEMALYRHHSRSGFTRVTKDKAVGMMWPAGQADGDELVMNVNRAGEC